MQKYKEALNSLESRLLKEIFYDNFEEAHNILEKEDEFLKFKETVGWLLKSVDSLYVSHDIKQKLNSKGITNILDIALLRPLRCENYTLRPLNELKGGEYCAVEGVVYSKKRTKKLISLTIKTNNGFLFCSWFRTTPFVRKLINSIKLNDEIVCEGQIRLAGFKYYMNHPRLKTANEFKERKDVIYPSILSMRNATVKKLVEEVLKKQPKKPYDYLPYTLIVRNKLLFLSETVDEIHEVENKNAVEKRLKYDEIFLLIMGLRLQESHLKERNAPKMEVNQDFLKKIEKNLDFSLTKDQTLVINEIMNDMRKNKPMIRLLQGDVGCGKTIVALIASIVAIKNRYQVAFMAPTQPLATQIFDETEKLIKDYPFKAVLLLSSTKSKDFISQDIKDGKIQIVVGTHTLLQEGVQFKNLGLIIIDEQHRFGVEQRKNLMNKGQFPHILIMSATPIPRSLSMVLYSNSNLSTIKEKPADRVDVKSFHFYSKNKDRAYDIAVREMERHHQVYVVAPLIEESDEMDNIENITRLYKELKGSYFKGFKVGFLHGQMKPKEKDEVIKRFKNVAIDCLISTTVIEVGIDSPNATVIIVESAERFGLSQLHQLRGRVGRSRLQSYAVFITQDDISETAEKRINALLYTNDGFEISELDYRLRGSGEIMGTRQHGKDLIYADILKDRELIEMVKKDVDRLIKMRYPINDGLKKMIEYRWQTKISYIDVG